MEKTYEKEECLEYAELKSNGDYINFLSIAFNPGMKFNNRIDEVKYGLESATKRYGTILQIHA